ncbi:hypothetical protein COV19_07385 [Candidatus Woesearchaeota archaeon CG10_big_fil_rev_8_21_14_0_10_44_13]|nr:MAG: hypothetical protein COV19_07385 [Candidatus Woesearchaeota archaeon CG10_big_fil_rev_8_21_14_0_10_44_13]
MTEDIPEKIKTYYERRKKLNKLLTSTQVEGSKAYDNATDLLKDEDGEIDLDKLKEDDMRKQFIDKITDHYISAAKKRLKSEVKTEDEFGVDMLLSGYAQVTKAEIEQAVNEKKHQYTKDVHNEVSKDLKKKQINKLIPALSSHFEDSDVSDIVKYTKADSLVHANRMRIDDALPFLDHFNKGKGSVTYEHVEGKHYAKKKAA